MLLVSLTSCSFCMKMKNKQGNARARQFVADVRAGRSDTVLQSRYGLSREKFYLYKATALDFIAKTDVRKTKNKIEINAKQFLVDIWSGMDDEALMAKYKLIPRHLQSAFRQIINAGLITCMSSAKMGIRNGNF